MIHFAVLNSLVSDVKKKIFACKLSDDFSGFVDTCGTGKRNHVVRSYWEIGEFPSIFLCRFNKISIGIRVVDNSSHKTYRMFGIMPISTFPIRL